MGKYKIKYNYNTGDSFTHEEGLEDLLELEFNDIDVAEKNLKRIEEHYKLYEVCEGRGSNWNRKKTNQELITECKDKDWLVTKMINVVFDPKDKKRYQAINEKDVERFKKAGREVGQVFDEYYANHCIILMSDEGKPFQIHCPWCGYFESLNFVEIEETSTRRINFK